MSIYRHEFVICPWCNGESGAQIHHLYSEKMPKPFGPWHCGKCRKQFSGTVHGPSDITLKKEHRKDRFSRQMVLLKIDSVNGPIFFVIDDDRYHSGDEKSEHEFQDHARYSFEEHSCPTNWLRDCVAVIQDADCDPHGIMTFVRAVAVPEDFDTDNDDNWRDLFPECFPITIDGETTKPAKLPAPTNLEGEEISWPNKS